MRIASVNVQNFRNIESAALTFRGTRYFFQGKNAQGKTNLLEALSLVTAVRSFRTHESGDLICHGRADCALRFCLEHESEGEIELLLRLSRKGKRIFLDGLRIEKLSEVVGRFPTVVFSSPDDQILRGSPAVRRRFMDFVISSMDRSYCEALRNYHRALESRNRLLKGIFVDAEIEAFEWQIALAAVIMVKTRGLWAEIFGEKASRFYADSSGSGEVLEFGYKADLAIADEGEYFARISALRERDAVLQATSRGPHRDDLSIRIDGQDARPFASEGQQRGCVIALRLAQVAWFYEVSGVLPVILIDDILGELDGERSERFWASLPRDMQVFATGTENLAISDREEWDIIGVKAGNFTCGEMDDGPVESLKRPGGKRIWEG